MDINIKDLNFSDEDIKLLIDGLESLPSKHVAGDMMMAMLDGLIRDKDDPDRESKQKKVMEDRQKKRDAENADLKENIVILQGKILQFKRWLLQENALKQANTILSKQ